MSSNIFIIKIYRVHHRLLEVTDSPLTAQCRRQYRQKHHLNRIGDLKTQKDLLGIDFLSFTAKTNEKSYICKSSYCNKFILEEAKSSLLNRLFH